MFYLFYCLILSTMSLGTRQNILVNFDIGIHKWLDMHHIPIFSSSFLIYLYIQNYFSHSVFIFSHSDSSIKILGSLKIFHSNTSFEYNPMVAHSGCPIYLSRNEVWVFKLHNIDMCYKVFICLSLISCVS